MKVDWEKTRCKLRVENPAVKLPGSPNTVRNHVQKWVGQDEKHDRVMDAQRMKLMAKKLKLKYMVKWMKRKSDPTGGFVTILAAKKKKTFVS
jgi:hypothetical protein